MPQPGNFCISGTAGYLGCNWREPRLVLHQSPREKEIKEGFHILLLLAWFPVETFCQVIHFLVFRSRHSPPSGAAPLPLQPQHLSEEAPGRWAWGWAQPPEPSCPWPDTQRCGDFPCSSAWIVLALLPFLPFLSSSMAVCPCARRGSTWAALVVTPLELRCIF